MRVVKLFVRSSQKAEFSAEFFNLFNHVNLANPISNLNAAVSSRGAINSNTEGCFLT